MRKDAIKLEEERLTGEIGLTPPYLHERHRIFPAVFDGRDHPRILDIASGIGYTAKRIQKSGNEIICNDIAPTCLRSLRQNGLPAVCSTIDLPNGGFPFGSAVFDAVIALATIEHVIHIDEFLVEIHRVLSPKGYLYLSAPNYASLLYLMPVLLGGKTFHDPIKTETRYEFYAHVRYFTYRTLLEFVPRFGFQVETVYVPLPQSSTTFTELQKRSPIQAALFRQVMRILYHFSPRWSSEPILCFRKDGAPNGRVTCKIL